VTAIEPSDDALFPIADAYAGDPLNPDLETVTPIEVVAELSPAERRQRVHALTDQAWEIIRLAQETHLRGRELVARCLLWSGGKDSNTLAHLMRSYATHVIHANTGIGIEATRQFVRDTAASWNLPLIEKSPPPGSTYREQVLEHGFPGPGFHWKMYGRLKERALDAARHDLGIAKSRTKAALYIAGRRRQESKRREDVPAHEDDGSVIWVSPIVMWTSLDLNTYREMHPDVPHNPVTDLIHMSGECLCGSYADEGEREQLKFWFPDVHAELTQLETEVRAAGHEEPRCMWGWGAYYDDVPSKAGRLCSNCRPPGQRGLFGEAPSPVSHVQVASRPSMHGSVMATCPEVPLPAPEPETGERP